MDNENRDRQDWTDESDVLWTKEQSKRDQRFDFSAFLGPESLEEQVTDALDGKDSGARRPAGQAGRGRHEVPGSAQEEDEQLPGEPPTQRFSRYDDDLPPQRPVRPAAQHRPASQRPAPRPYANEPPPRPKVVVADPAYSGGGGRDRGGSRNDGGGSGGGAKWLIGVLAVAIVVVLVVLFSSIFGGGGEEAPEATPSPTPTDYLAGLLRPNATAMPPATASPAPTESPRAQHTITVTAGSGGHISPSGSVDVEEGASVTFTIEPNEGYTLAQLIVDGSNVNVQSSYTFSDVKKDHTIYAVFQTVPATAPPTAEPTAAPTAEPTEEPAPEPTDALQPPPESETSNTGPG